MTYWRDGSFNFDAIPKHMQIGYATQAALGSVLIGLGKIPVSLAPLSVAGGATAEQIFTVAGLAVGDFVDLSPPAVTPGIGLGGARVSAANTLAVTFQNTTGGALTPPAGTYIVLVVR
jgi:hypothetical protein